MGLKQELAAIVEFAASVDFALPDKSVWRHYYKQAKKDMRSQRNGGGPEKWSGYGDWNPSRVGRSKAPVIMRGTDSKELKTIVEKGKFSSSWGGASADRPATFTSASHREASGYAAANGNDGRLLGLRKTIAAPENLHTAASNAMGATTKNFPLNKPIHDSDLRLVMKRTPGPAWNGKGPSSYESGKWKRPMSVGEIYPGLTHGPRKK